jgi:hypothetical protein
MDPSPTAASSGKACGRTEAAELACLREVETKLLLIGIRPPERALAVRDKAVHRDAHRIDQHGFQLIAPERQTIFVTTFTIELEIGLSFLLRAALPLASDPIAKLELIVVGGPQSACRSTSET